MKVVIIGAGHAAAQCVLNLKREGFTGSITMIGDEAYLPYMRPPLSKAFLQDQQTLEQLLIKPQSYYDDNDIHIVHASVENINRENKNILLDNGKTIAYTKLVIATGSQLRRLSITGSGLSGIYYLKNITDAEKIKSQLKTAKTMVVCGGGYIGLEVAASARKAGLEVTVIEMGECVMQRVVSSQTSAYFTRMHQQQGVNIVCNKVVQSFVGDTYVQTVRCQDGSEYSADIVVVGIGVIPETTLAEKAGLDVDNGIVVNEFCQSSDDDIYAMGDCANHYNHIYSTRLRLECIQNANGQAKTVAAHLTDKQTPYNEVPWFWSDQYDTKLQIAGLLNGYDELVIRGDIEGSDGYSVLALRDGVLIAVEAVKRPKDFMFAKKLIEDKVKPDINDLKNSEIALNTLVTN